jgi:1-aminocyclopropane-1-carboxylate deaminase
VSKWITYNEPKTVEVNLPFPGVEGVKVLIRREDQNHLLVSGNKWWKLKYNIERAIDDGYRTVLTFGGAYSNHIYATAAACRELELNCIGIIRGEAIENETLLFAKTCGMQLHFVSREVYRKKNLPEFQESLLSQYGSCYLIPEGGTNHEAVHGCEELGKKLLETSFDYLMLPVGTGGTIAGIINSFNGHRKIIGIPVLKDCDFLNEEIKELLNQKFNNWKLYLDYHHGGYAKTNAELNQFIHSLTEVGIPTEFVYTGKLFWAAIDLIRKKLVEPGSTVLILHTGGLRNS